MMEHLSAEQISQWMLGDRTPQLDRHVAECDACRAELRQMESALEQFRGSVRACSSSTPPPVWRQPETPGGWLSWPRLALAAATLLLLVSLPVLWSIRRQELQEQRQAAEAVLAADAQLLERVDSSISRAVPEPMEPLVEMVTWNSGSEQNTRVQRQ